MPRIKKIKRLTATIGGKQYLCVPSASCKGCAFETACYRVNRPKDPPEFNDFAMCSDMDFIYKEIGNGS